jgi:hypothetical protein
MRKDSGNWQDCGKVGDWVRTIRTILSYTIYGRRLGWLRSSHRDYTIAPTPFLLIYPSFDRNTRGRLALGCAHQCLVLCPGRAACSLVSGRLRRLPCLCASSVRSCGAGSRGSTALLGGNTLCGGGGSSKSAPLSCSLPALAPWWAGYFRQRPAPLRTFRSTGPVTASSRVCQTLRLGLLPQRTALALWQTEGRHWLRRLARLGDDNSSALRSGTNKSSVY